MSDHLGKKPPEHGEIVFEIKRSPVSLQSKSAKKNEFKEFVFSLIKGAGFLLSGDVKIIIEWQITEQHRYEHSNAYDVDNIIKPLLDSMSGPEGILVDDNQVQSIECYWMDIYQEQDEKLIVTIKYMNDEWLYKDGLEFVVFENNLCLPLWSNLKKEHQILFIESYRAGLELKNNALAAGMDYMHASLGSPIQRVFHKGRLKGFKVTSVADFLVELNNT